MNSENAVIGTLFQAIQARNVPQQLIDYIHANHPKSVVLTYYLGHWFDNVGKKELAATYYIKCTNIEPLFTPPYFPLAE